MSVLEIIGWSLMATPMLLGAFAFGLYPAIVWLWSRARPPFVLAPEPAEWPSVTILIVAYNEEQRLGRTIETALAVDYPAHQLDVLVVSDASTDGTDALVRDYGDPRVRLLRQSERRGKPAGENASGAQVTGDYVVSIDASILIPRDSLKPLVRALLVPGVGLASGRDLSVGDEAREGNRAESSYVGLEMTLRAHETRVDSIVGASGCFYAARRDLHARPLPEHLSRDFAAASVARQHGYRAVSVDDAPCLVPRTPTLQAELRRKSRTMGRGLGTLLFLRGMLNPFRYGSFAFMMAGHKLARWLLFPALLGWMLGPLLLIRSAPYTLVLLAGMTAGLLLAWLTLTWPEHKRLPTLVAFPGYVFVSIVAGWMAWWHLLKRDKLSTWEPTRRPATALPASGGAAR